MRAEHTLLFLGGLLLGLPAHAVGVDPACQDLFEEGRPADYDEQQQQDFLANYYALVASSSGVHAPIPHEPRHGMLGVRLNGMPPLPCRRRFALEFSKTEDTNVTPVVPALTASYAFEGPDGVVPYAEVAFLPPIPIRGTRNLLFQAAIGIGFQVTDELQLGARAHGSVLRTIGDIATPINEGDPVVDDLYLGSTLGIQALGGWSLGPVTPYVMVGLLDASTFFYVGDSSIVTNNLHPYLGPEWALGLDGLVADDRLRWGIEYYAAPGGSRTLNDASRVDGWGAYGRLHTVRARIGVEL
jgi:hypothetical protein